MSTRLGTGGRLIDRSKTISFTFNGQELKGHQGDTLASALLANGQDREAERRSKEQWRERILAA